MKLAPTLNRGRHCQRGTTLLEALVAFLVLSLGMLSVARVQTQLRLNSDIARQRSEAVRLGQEDMEGLRAFSVMGAAAGARAYADITSASVAIGPESGYATNTRYVLERRIDADAAVAHAKTATVSVGWTDRGGSAQQVVLHSIISGSDPAYSGALGIAPGTSPVQGAFARRAAIPLGARDLGNGSSAFKPVAGGTVALVFDNHTGLVSARCSGVNAALATKDLTAADLTGCDAASGYLLSGVVRFTSAALPDPAQANDVPLALGVVLALSGGAYTTPPYCASEAQKTVSYSNASGLHIEAVPIAATPGSLGLVSWSESGDRYVAYHCAVYPLANGQWSGRSTITPSGWSIGGGPLDRRVCRYSADLDASGAVDANLEHPGSYSGVAESLAQQDFLVIKGSAICPGAAAQSVEGRGSDVFANLGTLPHQP